jgi:hypothetical protein
VRVRDPLFEKLVAKGKFDYAYNIRVWEDVDGHILYVYPYSLTGTKRLHLNVVRITYRFSQHFYHFILTVVCCIPIVSPRFITWRFLKWYPQDPFSAVWIPWSLHRKRRHFSCQSNSSVRQNVIAVIFQGKKNDKVPKYLRL